MKHAMKMLVYMVSGAIMDLFITLYTRAVSMRQKPLAVFLTIIITYVTFVVFRKVVVRWSWWLAAAYAIGTGIGTFVALLIM
jgi:multidrug transporter EmrE-like cation transporter